MAHTGPAATSEREAAVEGPVVEREGQEPLEKKPLPERYSPSRLADFKKCPKAFWFKTVEKLPTKPTAAQLKGTLVHAALEHMFNRPRSERTHQTAHTLLDHQWQELKREEQYSELVETLDEDDFIAEARELVDNYFSIENPQVFDPASNEMWVRADIETSKFHGIIDRLDKITMPDGEVRVYISDYKTGKKPKPNYQKEAFFAMRVYALLLQEQGERAKTLRLLYLKESGKQAVLTQEIDDQTLQATRNEILELTEAIDEAWKTETWPTKVGPLCGWCDFQHVCPEFARETGGPIRLNPW